MINNYNSQHQLIINYFVEKNTSKLKTLKRTDRIRVAKEKSIIL
jgi:hypothetical protein